MAATETTGSEGIERFSFLANGLDHPEGVAWDPAAGVLYAGGEAGQLYAIAADGSFGQVADTGAFMLGLAVDADGRVYACAGSQVLRIAPSDGTVEVYATGTEAEPLRTPNHPAFAADGTLYVTDSGDWDGSNGLVYRVLPDGTCEVWTRALAHFPNGCCLTREGAALLVVQSQVTPGVYRLPIEPDGAAGAPELVCALPGTVPDGVALDADGRVYVALYTPDRVQRLEADGTLTTVVGDACSHLVNRPTNVAFMGERLDRLATANLGGWHVALGDVGATGHPLPRPAIGR